MAAKKTTAKKKAEAVESSLRHPRDTLELHGQSEGESLFLQSYNSGRLPHAWLLTGPKGIGKATLAYRMARFLLAGRRGATSLNVDMESAAIHRLQAGSHTDVLVLQAAEGSDISVDEARGVVEFLAMTPAEGAWRVVIIDSIDAMNRNAANALLKTLEEPPARTVMLLISHNPGGLLPTIRSRCRVLKLKPLGDEAFARIVREHMPDADAETIRQYHVLSGGSPGVALFLIEQEALALYHAFLSLFAGGKRAPEWHQVHALADQLASKQDAARFQAAQYMLQYWFRQVIRLSGGQPIDELLDGEGAVLAHIAQFRSTEEWLRLWEEVSDVLTDVRRIYLDRKQVLINIIAAMQPNGKFLN
ncbi:MAG: DNA polymerase III subunit delta' [Alphaproteobacteria bacterium]|nr:DNA polymerase III subunit delta' [Alphaproteobacteria bacterium]